MVELCSNVKVLTCVLVQLASTVRIYVDNCDINITFKKAMAVKKWWPQQKGM